MTIKFGNFANFIVRNFVVIGRLLKYLLEEFLYLKRFVENNLAGLSLNVLRCLFIIFCLKRCLLQCRTPDNFFCTLSGPLNRLNARLSLLQPSRPQNPALPFLFRKRQGKPPKNDTAPLDPWKRRENTKMLKKEKKGSLCKAKNKEFPPKKAKGGQGRTPSAICSAIGRPYLARSRIHAGRSSQPPRF